ncbi:plasmid pRiA4b ORF-3 family protein [Mangrovibacterium sp.]|uniref:plasmid pRiA4b ORF-3 family protein n=1 Tax=Mangrovibacterium sp. TaxID=1961364 RepID=UPI00356AC17D
MAKKQKGKVVQMLSPENYIRQRSRTLPIHECWVTKGWEQDKKVSIMITRKHTNGNLTMGFFLVDLLCLGVKDAHFKFNIPAFEYAELLQELGVENEMVRADYTLAHNLILASVEFAEDFGFKPHKDFTSTMQYFLAEDNDEVELIEIECGYQGQPMYVRGPFDSDADVAKVLSQLDKSAGFGNYRFIDNPEAMMDDDWDEEDGFFDEDNLKELREMLSIQSPGYQFKVQLDGISKPPVWRRVVVPSHYTFDYFHTILQDVFGWEEEHLFQFSPNGFGSYPVIKVPDEFDEDGQDLDAAEINLSDIFKEEGQRYTYIYDFGDCWKHRIQLEKILPEPISRPTCLDGKGNCPPEDCGGVVGFENLKKIVQDPKHPEYDDMRDWLMLEEDESWDPKDFDLQQAQRELDTFYNLDNFSD